MASLSIALLLRPIAALLLFALVVAPLTWALYRAFPDGPLKVALFKVRTDSRQDRMVRWAALGAAVLFLAALFTLLAAGR